MLDKYSIAACRSRNWRVALRGSLACTRKTLYYRVCNDVHIELATTTTPAEVVGSVGKDANNAV